MNIKKIILITILGCMTFTGFCLDVIIDEKPVSVPLPVGKEIIVKFPKAVTQIETLDGTTDGLKQFLRPDGVLLLTAGEELEKTRVVATMIDGNVVLLDLNPSIGAINHEIINLVEPKSLKKSSSPETTVKPNNSVNEEEIEENPYKPAFLQKGAAMTKNAADQPSKNTSIGFNQMVQYGFRHFVGPSRLIGKQKAKVVSVSRIQTSQFVRMWHNRLSVKPLRQWKMGDKYVTVLLVNNISSVPVEFDPRALRGRLMFAAALYPVIQPRGSHQDQTLWAVVTAIPFNKAVR